MQFPKAEKSEALLRALRTLSLLGLQLKSSTTAKQWCQLLGHLLQQASAAWAQEQI